MATVCDTRTQVLSLLADLLDYPDARLARTALDCRELVEEATPAAAALLDDFVADIESIPPGRLEEYYAGAFDFDLPTDVDVTCYPYIGHHLLGESYRRSRFMVGLIERYREHGFEAPEGELPDHVLVMLRFLAHAPDSELAEELVGEALLPALARMTDEGDERELEGEGGRRIYLRVLEAVRLVLRDQLWPDTPVSTYDLVLDAVGAGEGRGS
jgi:nitrate reductase delta subunit